MISYRFCDRNELTDQHWSAFTQITKQHLEEDQDYKFACIIVDEAIEDVEVTPKQRDHAQECGGLAVLFTRPLRALRKASPETAPFLKDFLDADPKVKLLIEGFERVTDRLVIFVGYVQKNGEPLWLEVPDDQEKRWRYEGRASDRKAVAKRKRFLGIANR